MWNLLFRYSERVYYSVLFTPSMHTYYLQSCIYWGPLKLKWKFHPPINPWPVKKTNGHFSKQKHLPCLSGYSKRMIIEPILNISFWSFKALSPSAQLSNKTKSLPCTSVYLWLKKIESKLAGDIVIKVFGSHVIPINQHEHDPCDITRSHPGYFSLYWKRIKWPCIIITVLVFLSVIHYFCHPASSFERNIPKYKYRTLNFIVYIIVDRIL